MADDDPRSIDQDAFFADGEGDRFYERNAEKLGTKGRDPVMHLLEQYGARPKTVAELGCADGWRLSLIRESFGARCLGIDASPEAVRGGMERDPELELVQGTLAELPWETATLDVVAFVFVLCWNDRATLLRAFTEADRVLKNGGLMIIGDFDPDHPVRRPYHHRPDLSVFTYKQDYSQVLLSTNLYRPLARLSYLTGTEEERYRTELPSDTRAFCTLMKKSLTGYYQELPNP